MNGEKNAASMLPLLPDRSHWKLTQGNRECRSSTGSGLEQDCLEQDCPQVLERLQVEVVQQLAVIDVGVLVFIHGSQVH